MAKRSNKSVRQAANREKRTTARPEGQALRRLATLLGQAAARESLFPESTDLKKPSDE